jgi:hypothetical protein
VTARMKYKMRLPMSEREDAEWRGEIVDAQAYDPAELPAPPVQNETFWSSVKSFFGGKRSRQPSDTTQSKNSTVSQQELETIAQSVDAMRAWNETPTGRERLWCKTCRDEGKPWLTPEPCEHILSATAEEIVPFEVAMRTLVRLMNEPTPQEPSYHPVPMEPTNE